MKIRILRSRIPVLCFVQTGKVIIYSHLSLNGHLTWCGFLPDIFHSSYHVALHVRDVTQASSVMTYIFFLHSLQKPYQSFVQWWFLLHSRMCSPGPLKCRRNDAFQLKVYKSMIQRHALESTTRSSKWHQKHPLTSRLCSSFVRRDIFWRLMSPQRRIES